MAAIGLYLEKISYLSTSEVIEQRKGIFRNVNGDAFLPSYEDVSPRNETAVFEKNLLGTSRDSSCCFFALETVALLIWFVRGFSHPNHGNLKRKASTPSILCNEQNRHIKRYLGLLRHRPRKNANRVHSLRSITLFNTLTCVLCSSANRLPVRPIDLVNYKSFCVNLVHFSKFPTPFNGLRTRKVHIVIFFLLLFCSRPATSVMLTH